MNLKIAIGKPFIDVNDGVYSLKQDFSIRYLQKDETLSEPIVRRETIGFTTQTTQYMNKLKASQWAKHYGIRIPQS